MDSKITTVKRGTTAAMMAGDVVTTKTVPHRNGRVIRLNNKTVTIRPSGDGNHQLMELRRQDVRNSRTRDSLPVEIGCRVRVQNGSQKGTGTLERVDGGYNYIRYGDNPDNILELYPNEFRVVAVYRHPDFIPGTIVRFADAEKIAWGKVKRTTHGVVLGVASTKIVVQPMGSRSIMFLGEEELALEVSKARDPLAAEDLSEQDMLKHAIRALLVTCGGMMVVQLTGLLATQGHKDETVRTALFELVAEGKASIDPSHVMVSAVDKEDIVQGEIRDNLFAATDAVRKAKVALADAVFKAIADTGSRLPR